MLHFAIPPKLRNSRERRFSSKDRKFPSKDRKFPSKDCVFPDPQIPTNFTKIHIDRNMFRLQPQIFQAPFFTTAPNFTSNRIALFNAKVRL